MNNEITKLLDGEHKEVLGYGSCFRCGCPEVGGTCQNYGCETPRTRLPNFSREFMYGGKR
jgi:hypothetical protein